MVPLLLIQNLLHTAVALVWLLGLRQLIPSLSAALWANLLRCALVLPVLVALGHGVQMQPAAPHRLLRLEFWAPMGSTDHGAFIPLILLLAGSGFLFLFQELWPALRQLRRPLRTGKQNDRLQRGLQNLRPDFVRCGLAENKLPTCLVVQSAQPFAALQGLRNPRIVLSTTLLETLDDRELEGVLAHEIAHAHLGGGNIGRALIWVFRSLQGLNPGALLLFRRLLLAEESRCDAWAARVTQRPMALASALLKMHDNSTGDGQSPSQELRGQEQLRRRAERVVTQMRVRQLIDCEGLDVSDQVVMVCALATLTGLLWLVA